MEYIRTISVCQLPLTDNIRICESKVYKMNRPNTLGERIISVLRGTQAEIGAKIGVSQDTISDWKRGKSTPPLDKLEKICSISGVDLVWLVNGRTANTGAVVNAYFPFTDSNRFDSSLYKCAKKLTEYAISVYENSAEDFCGFTIDAILGASSIYYIASYSSIVDIILPEPPFRKAQEYEDAISEALKYGKSVIDKDKRNILVDSFKEIKECFSLMISDYMCGVNTDEGSEYYGSLLSIKNLISQRKTTDKLFLPLIGSAAADNAAYSRALLEPEAPGEEIQVIKEHYRLVRIIGNSMEPVILDGQYALIGSEIGKGEAIKAKGWLGIIQVDCAGLDDGICDGVATFCKRVYPVDKKTLMLTSINSAECAPFTVARQHVLHLWPVHGVFFMGHGVAPIK